MRCRELLIGALPVAHAGPLMRRRDCMYSDASLLTIVSWCDDTSHTSRPVTAVIIISCHVIHWTSESMPTLYYGYRQLGVGGSVLCQCPVKCPPIRSTVMASASVSLFLMRAFLVTLVTKIMTSHCNHFVANVHYINIEL